MQHENLYNRVLFLKFNIYKNKTKRLWQMLYYFDQQFTTITTVVKSLTKIIDAHSYFSVQYLIKKLKVKMMERVIQNLK